MDTPSKVAFDRRVALKLPLLQIQQKRKAGKPGDMVRRLKNKNQNENSKVWIITHQSQGQSQTNVINQDSKHNSREEDKTFDLTADAQTGHWRNLPQRKLFIQPRDGWDSSNHVVRRLN